MKASELRIGNFFDWSPLASMGRGQDQVTVSNIGYHYLMNPITITEEWLVKFGFKCVHIKNIHYTVNDPNGVAELHKISIFPTVNNQWHIAFSDELNGYKDYIPTTKISHVHQLQNLYFALTGEELTIKN